MNWLALDIGGANLKAADGKGYAASHGFALWSDSRQLARELRMMIAEAPLSDHLVVTMTGELADCFSSRSEGVRFILESLGEACDGRHTRVYLHSGHMVTPQVALRDPLRAASSNWHALARFAARFAGKEPALLVDVGSTTCDIVPLVEGAPAHQGVTDTERMLLGELLYTGVERSPVCAVVNSVPYRGQPCAVAQEMFATTRDVYLLLGDLAEQPTDTMTADKRPASKGFARVRMGRMICATEDEFNHRDAVAVAEAVAQSQAQRLAGCVSQVSARMPARPTRLILSGQGEFLARRMLRDLSLDVETVSLSQQLGLAVSRAAPAHALAVLAAEAVSP